MRPASLSLTAIRACRGLLFGAVLLGAVAPALASAPPTSPLKVSGAEISMLIRSTVLALHQANLTANYSVLHDLGDSRFQAVYNQAALSDMFRGFRDQRVNLEPAILYDAVLDAPPKLTTDGTLRVVGHFPTAPEQVIFDITFRSQGGIWRIDALNAGMRPAAGTALPKTANGAAEAPQIKPVASAAPVPLEPPAREPVAVNSPDHGTAPQIGVVSETAPSFDGF